MHIHSFNKICGKFPTTKLDNAASHVYKLGGTKVLHLRYWGNAITSRHHLLLS